MFDKSKLIILVTGTTIEPWAQNWKECNSTWIPEIKNWDIMLWLQSVIQIWKPNGKLMVI